jgi:2'-5' RNA ligase
VTERLFFALWPGASQREALSTVQQALPPGRGRLVHREDLHITLAFLGDVDAPRRSCAEETADGVRVVPFDLMLDRFGCFPRSRVLWCGSSARPQPLLALVHALNGGLIGCGFRLERRPFHPHATLARKSRPLPARALEAPIDWPVSAFSLVTSVPRERPRYRVLRTWPLVS